MIVISSDFCGMIPPVGRNGRSCPGKQKPRDGSPLRGFDFVFVD